MSDPEKVPTISFVGATTTAVPLELNKEIGNEADTQTLGALPSRRAVM
jgi:hypothetical protein